MNRGGMIAAGHPLTAEAGARILREGGNAVDAAVGAVLASWVAEPLLTGPGAGGYLLVAGAGEEPTLLDFFVEAPGRGADPARRAELAAGRGLLRRRRAGLQLRRGLRAAPTGRPPAWRRRWSAGARSTLAALAAPAAALARDGVALNAAQAYVFEILEPILAAPPPESRAAFAPEGGRCARASASARAELAETIERFGRRGRGAVLHGRPRRRRRRLARAPRGGQLTRADLAAYAPAARAPVRATYRGPHGPDQPAAVGRRDAAGAGAWRASDERSDGAPSAVDIVAVMEEAQALRTPAFVEGLVEPGFADRFLASRLGSTTHISVARRRRPRLRGDVHQRRGLGPRRARHRHPREQRHGRAGPQPAGLLHLFPPGRRMPSMMAPDRRAGDRRRGRARARQRRLQPHPLGHPADHRGRGRPRRAGHDAVLAPRVHFEDGVVYAEPGIDAEALRDAGREVVAFRDRNLFFGGVQAVERDRAPARSRAPATRAAAAPRWLREARRGGPRRAGGTGAERLRRRGARPVPRHPQRRRPRREADAARHRRRPCLVQRPAAGRHHERPADRRARERARRRACREGAAAPGRGRRAGLLLPRPHRGRAAWPGATTRRASRRSCSSWPSSRATWPRAPATWRVSVPRRPLSNSPVSGTADRERPCPTQSREGDTWRTTEVSPTRAPARSRSESIDFPKLELQDGPGVHPDNVGRKTEHGVILKIVSTNICGSDQHMVRGRTTAPEG